jgi:hypothetical protein
MQSSIFSNFFLRTPEVSAEPLESTVTQTQRVESESFNQARQRIAQEISERYPELANKLAQSERISAELLLNVYKISVRAAVDLFLAKYNTDFKEIGVLLANKREEDKNYNELLEMALLYSYVTWRTIPERESETDSEFVSRCWVSPEFTGGLLSSTYQIASQATGRLLMNVYLAKRGIVGNLIMSIYEKGSTDLGIRLLKEMYKTSWRDTEKMLEEIGGNVKTIKKLRRDFKKAIKILH